jgi:hypothetical protein
MSCADPDLGHEAVVGAKPTAEIAVLRREVEHVAGVDPAQRGSVSMERAAIPLRREIGPIRRVREAVQQLPDDAVALRWTPLEIWSAESIEAATLDLACGTQQSQAGEAGFETQPGDTGPRSKLLFGGRR